MHTKEFAKGLTKVKAKKIPDSELTARVKDALRQQAGRTVKDLSETLKVNRTYMAGALAVLEESGEVSSRPAGPARIYFLTKP